jgi:hypothetical protein
LNLQEIKKKFYFQNIKKNIFYYLFLSLTFSFVFQPINIRFAGYSVTLFLMLIFLLLALFKIKKILLNKKNLIIYPILIYLIINYIFIADKRIISILICLGFYLSCTTRLLNYFQIQNVLKVLYLVLIFLLFFAWYKFYNQFIAKNIINNIYLEHYPFLSLDYAPGARGYSSFYFILGCVLSYFFYLRSQKINRFINFFIFLFFIFSVILSQSLSAYLILIFLLIFYFKFYILLLLSSSLQFLIFLVKFFFKINLIEYRFFGNFSYNSSIQERFYIIKLALLNFLDNPFGSTVYDLTYKNWIHSENTFVDIVVIYGICGVLFLIVSLIFMIKNLKFSSDIDLELVNFFLFTILLFLFFHSSSNFFIIYLILVLVINMYKIKKIHKVTK